MGEADLAAVVEAVAEAANGCDQAVRMGAGVVEEDLHRSCGLLGLMQLWQVVA